MQKKLRKTNMAMSSTPRCIRNLYIAFTIVIIFVSLLVFFFRNKLNSLATFSLHVPLLAFRCDVITILWWCYIPPLTFASVNSSRWDNYYFFSIVFFSIQGRIKGESCSCLFGNPCVDDRLCEGNTTTKTYTHHYPTFLTHPTV